MIALAGCSIATSVALFYGQDTITGLVMLAFGVLFSTAAIYYKSGKHIHTASTILCCILIASLTALQFTNPGADWGAYAFAPTLIVLCIFLLNRLRAFISSLLILVCVGLSITETSILQNNNTYPNEIVIPTSFLAFSYGPLLIASLALIYFIFSNYREAHQRALKDLTNAQLQTKSDHLKIEESLDKQRLLAKMQMRLQHAGKLSGWWFDAKHKTLFINIKHPKGEYEVCELALNEDLALSSEAKTILNKLPDPHLWLEAVIPQVITALDTEQPWDIEVSPDQDGPYVHKRWYRSVGEVDYGEQSIKYLFGVIQDITATKAMTRRLEYQANYDDLTSLYNRRYIEDTLQKLVESPRVPENTYYLFIDLDRFKTVNDSSGHTAGDELLRTIAKIIHSCLPETGVAGRIGGDEFGVILSGSDEEQTLSLANSIREQIEGYCFNWEGSHHRIAATIGVVKIDERINSRDHLQSIADSACLDAKSEGRNRVKLCYGDNVATTERRENSRWLQRIQDALINEQFALFVQEIHRVDKEASDRNTYEVLLRMRTSDKQHMVLPSAFLPVAERYNLSTDIDRWVVSRVIDIAEEQQAKPNTPVDIFWINLSGQSMGDLEFADFLIDLLEKANLEPASINFEITETAVIGDMENAIKLMQRLRAMGSQFALDDFGAGLASFGYLKKLPVDLIKIDGMFIREIDVTKIDRAFTKSIVDVAHSIGIQTVAEFVENDNIRQTVTDLGIDFMQGFGIHKPEEIENTMSIDSLAAG